jgi:hypothetical protein
LQHQLTDWAKQQVTSRHRHSSGFFCSPQRPLQGQVPLQQMYLHRQESAQTLVNA